MKKLVLTVLLTGCASPPPVAAPGPAGDWPPPVRREFRGVWIATVSNIDWPSRPGLPTDSAREELRGLIERVADLGMNAVIFQVRPAGDALYASELEPWSEYLTGAQGRAPEPAWDPLAFAIEEAHARGLELHAWFNPYRARHPSARSEVAASHLARRRPELVKEYGTHLWMDPGEPEVRRHSLSVLLDVVRRYDVDGVHLDDYFYPYKERDSAGALIDFPDSASYARFRAAGGSLGKEDWRRNNVDALVRELYAAVKREKPEVKVGISPFGIWRPGYPAQIQGFDAYAQIYADARRWLERGWVDYFAPQLYWPVDQTPQSFPVLLRWWAERNAFGRHLWPGMIPNRVERDGSGWAPAEVAEQVRLTRAQSGASGHILFSMRALAGAYGGVGDSLSAGPYAEPALVPASPWLDAEGPGVPVLTLRGTTLSFRLQEGESPFRWLVRSRRDGRWSTRVVPGGTGSLEWTEVPEVVWVSAVDRTGNVGPGAVMRGG